MAADFKIQLFLLPRCRFQRGFYCLPGKTATETEVAIAFLLTTWAFPKAVFHSNPARAHP